MLYYDVWSDDMKEKKAPKTNAMRILDRANIDYSIITYEHDGTAIDGIHVADILHQDPKRVFKTLVTIANTKVYYVFIIPVSDELDLKKAAKAVNVKAIDMIHVKDINRITGYVRGGCSPIGMKKKFTTCIHKTCLGLDNIMFSGGQIGCQISMNPQDLSLIINIQYKDLIKEHKEDQS